MIESSKILYTVKEVAELLKSNKEYVHKLRKSGLLRFLKVGQFKVRKETLEKFLHDFEGFDVTDPFNVIPLSN